ncbi:26S protease regulatory subunit 7-like protein [Leptotrombidium deliense]|uniref:26S proteasome regulatory subunit 7 n=1 Tax=Leptotrombidium deliense TaxID=299467 RepID=A0A443SBR0_9ACAR|nr:26S protease regulatory subunit 7-like protein [Leptotrombidium deliense]
MTDHLGKDMRKEKTDTETEKPIKELKEGDIEVLESYSFGLYDNDINGLTADIQNTHRELNELRGVKESPTGITSSDLWNIRADMSQIDPSRHVARVTTVTKRQNEPNRYTIAVRNFGRYVTQVAPFVQANTIESGMRVAVERGSYRITRALPPSVDPIVSMMQVEEKPNVTYQDVGGCKEQIEKLREVVEFPLLDPKRFEKLGILPPRGVLLYGPPGTGKTLCARAVANKTEACFIRVIGSELVQKYIGEGARMVRELFRIARMKKACIIFFDEIDAIGGTRYDDGSGGGDNEVQRTMLELINQLDVPKSEGRSSIFKIHTKNMSVDENIRYELLSRMCPNCTGAEIGSVCAEAGMFAIRERRKLAKETDFLKAVLKVVKGDAKYSATARYMTYN